MDISFSKYHGAGNDFVIIDTRKSSLNLNSNQIKQLCHRRFGIGADGLMLLQNSAQETFKMKYYNSDGIEGTMCGNGGRCIVAFASDLGLLGTGTKTSFEAIDGVHHAQKLGHNNISLCMNSTQIPVRFEDGFFVDTGSPHFVKFVPDISQIDAETEGRLLRFEKRFAPKGTNVNFVQILLTGLRIVTFERGVEAITLACGTGAVAAAVCFAELENKNSLQIPVISAGGELFVTLEKKPDGYHNIVLSGPAMRVFTGTFSLVSE